MNILDILKNMDAGTPGPASGPGSKERPNHRYIKRTWNAASGSWDYEYAGEKHQNHGIHNADKDEHTLEIPDSVGEQHHERAGKGSKDALKEIYGQSKAAAADLPSTKGDHVGTHPVTGHPVRYNVGADKGSPTGYRIKVFNAQIGPDGQPILDKNGKPKWEKKNERGATDWDNIRKWQKMAPHQLEIKGADGNIHYVITPVSGEIDDETNSPKPAADGNNYRVKVTKHAPESGLMAKRAEIRGKDMESVKATLEKLRAAHATAQETATKKPASALLQEGMSAQEILEGGHLPQKVANRGGRLHNNFASDEEKDVVIDKVAREYGDKIRDWAEKKGHPIDGDLDDILSDKNSSMYRTLDSVVRNYQPKDSRTLESHILGTLNYVNVHGWDEKNDKGERVHQRGVATSGNMSLDAAAGDGKAETADAAASGVKTKKEGGGSKAAEDVEDSILSSIDDREAVMDQYRDEQLHKLESFAQQYMDNNDVQALVSSLKNGLKTSSDADEYHGLVSEKLGKMGLSSLVPHVLVHPDDVRAGMGKSLKNSWVLDDFCKSYAQSYAVTMMNVEDNLAKADAGLPPDDYSHSDGGLYPRFYYKDQKGNQVRYTNAPDGSPDASGQFGAATRHPGEPDMAKNPEFFTPDGRKLSRAPYPGAPVQWNQSYHPDDKANLWAGRWVNPQTGAHEYTYIEADLLGNQELSVHRQNVIVDARLPVLRKYTAALFQSPNIKDKVTGLMLALLDQGKFRIRELASLSVGDVVNSGDVITIGRRQVLVDSGIRNVLAAITAGRIPQDPLFAVPRVGIDGGVDYGVTRRLGPHYVINILEEVGVPLAALATYHASQTYSMEIQRMFSEHQTSYEAAHAFAMLEVAGEMGHNLDHVDDYENAIQILAATIVDPVVINVIKQNVTKMGLHGGPDYLKRPVHQTVYQVFSTLADLTPDEKLFSEWLHTAPVHEYVQ